MLTAERVPDNCPALVLNADYRPLSYFPLSLWSWQDAIKAVFLERVNIVSEYEFKVRSPSFESATIAVAHCPPKRVVCEMSSTFELNSGYAATTAT